MREKTLCTRVSVMQRSAGSPSCGFQSPSNWFGRDVSCRIRSSHRTRSDQRPQVAGKRPLAGRTAFRLRFAQPSRAHRRLQCRSNARCSLVWYGLRGVELRADFSFADRSKKLSCGASCESHTPRRRVQLMQPTDEQSARTAVSTDEARNATDSGTGNRRVSVLVPRSRPRRYAVSAP